MPGDASSLSPSRDERKDKNNASAAYSGIAVRGRELGATDYKISLQSVFAESSVLLGPGESHLADVERMGPPFAPWPREASSED